MTVFASRSGGPVTGPPSVVGVPPAGTDNSWKQHANCRGEDPDLWFPPDKVNATEAKRICAACQVRDDCLEYALANNITFGIWGGLSRRERKQIRKDRARAALASAPTAAARAVGAVPCVVRPVAAPARPLDGRTAHHP